MFALSGSSYLFQPNFPQNTQALDKERYVNEPLSHCTAEGNKQVTVDLELNMRSVNICFLFVVVYVALGKCNSWLDERDYGFLFWPKNHKSGDGGYSNIEHIQTGTYGVVLDVSTASLVNLGLIQDPLPVEEALVSDNSVVRGDPISTYARVTQRTQTGARRKITLPVRTYLMEAPLGKRLSVTLTEYKAMESFQVYG